MIEFSGDDVSYIFWVKAYPQGFVMNVRMSPDPHYVVLHRANCRSISDDRRVPGAYTARHYRKLCSLSLSNLSNAAKREGRPDGSFSKRCALCKP